MKISGKVYLLITNLLIYEILIGLHNSLNTRLDSLASRNDNLPINFGHYNQDLGIEGGQGVMRVFFTSLSTSLHMK
jgi:hypothetical protein